MQAGQPVDTVYLNVGIWYDEQQGRIHLVTEGITGFHATISDDPSRRHGHPSLFRDLALCLAVHGAAAPKNLF